MRELGRNKANVRTVFEHVHRIQPNFMLIFAKNELLLRTIATTTMDGEAMQTVIWTPKPKSQELR